MRKFILPLGLLALICLAACAPLATPQPTGPTNSSKLPPLDGNWQLQFSQSGGIMGMSRTLTVSSDGSLTAVDDRTQATVAATLTPADLAHLKSLAAAASYPTVIPATGCADCFYFRLQLSGRSAPLDVQLDQINLAGSGLAQLFGFLQDEMVNLLGN